MIISHKLSSQRICMSFNICTNYILNHRDLKLIKLWFIIISR